MKIVRCSKCGKYIHKTAKCFHCCNTIGFDEIDSAVVNENVSGNYARMELLINDKRYDEAMELSYAILDRTPNLSGVFWLRLLAKNKCSTAIELISKGFADDDADFCNALNYSTGEEYSAYEDIQKIVFKIRKLLKEEIDNHECKCKFNTNIMQIKSTMSMEMDERKRKLFSLWSDLENIEKSLYLIEMDCQLLINEHQRSLERAVEESSAIKRETIQMEECTTNKLHELQMRMDNVLHQSEISVNSIEDMKKQHHLVKKFSDLLSQRDQKEKFISYEIESLVSYEQYVQQTISEIESIESLHRAARIASDKYDFIDIAALLGVDTFNQILHTAGVGMDAAMNILSEGSISQLTIDSALNIDADKCGAYGKSDDYDRKQLLKRLIQVIQYKAVK